MSSNSLDMLNVGFFLYVIEGDGCVSIVGPSVQGVPHETALYVGRTDVDISGRLDISVDRQQDLLKIDVSGFSMSVSQPQVGKSGRPAGARIGAQDLALIPDFTDVCCGAALNPDWRKQALQCVFNLSGGTIEAVPDDSTYETLWQWLLCDGTPHEQFVTTKTRYTREADDPIAIEIADVATSAQVGKLTFPPGTVEAMLMSAPPASVALPKKSSRTLDPIEHAHVAALLSLTVPKPQQLFVPEKTPGKPKKIPATPVVRPVNPRFGQLVSQFNSRHNGTPECSGGRMKL